MNSYKTIINTCAILLSSVLVVSCGDSADTQSQSALDSNPVIVGLSGPIVALSSNNVSAGVGETFTLDITMSDFPTSEGGGVNVQFDATMLKVDSVTVDSGFWDFKNKDGVIDNNSGIVSDILFSSYKGVSGDSKIASIVFTATNSGKSKITLTNSLANPFASNGEKIAVTFVNTEIQIVANSAN